MGKRKYPPLEVVEVSGDHLNAYPVETPDGPRTQYGCDQWVVFPNRPRSAELPWGLRVKGGPLDGTLWRAYELSSDPQLLQPPFATWIPWNGDDPGPEYQDKIFMHRYDEP